MDSPYRFKQDLITEQELRELRAIDPAKMITDRFTKVLEDLEGMKDAKPKAADLTDEQKCAMLYFRGWLDYKGGRFTSLTPVGFSDRPEGGYLIQMMAP
mgnify:CR=1 FL=1